MIDFLIEVLSALRFPKRKTEYPRERVPPLPAHAKLKMPAVALAYEYWAMQTPGVSVEDADGYRVMVRGILVRIRTGLRGSAPVSVEVEVHVAHDAPTVLITALDADTHPAARRLAQPFLEDPDYVLPIRSIGFAPGLIRIRMAPLTPPGGVMRVLERVAAMAPSPAEPRPYRG